MKLTTHHKVRYRSFRPRLESLETRLTPTTYTVSSLADSGEGSLRAAITSVNADPAGSVDEIDFSVAGVIKLTSGALPAVTNTVNINGRSAPGFVNAPVIEIDNNGFAGLTINASNSKVSSLSLVNSPGAGLTLQGSDRSTIVGNYLGLALDGSVAANDGGLTIDNSREDLIGGKTGVDRNVISGHGDIGTAGIAVGPFNFESAVTIEGNYIGTDPTGQIVLGSPFFGINLESDGNTVGGLDPSAGNVVAGAGWYGINIDGVSNAILSNSIYDSAVYAIFLNGGNANQQPPTPFVAIPKGANTEISGTMNGQANTAYTIQLFASPKDGEGRTFLGTLTATTNAGGFASFTLEAQVPGNAGSFFTATATSPAGNTSRISGSIGLSTTPNQAYVASVYGLLFNRAPDPFSEIWVDQLNAGVSTGQVLLEIQGSTEYLRDQVAALYNRYLQRSPDAGGGQAWFGYLQAGGTFEGMAEGLTSSPEYFGLQGGTDQGFVTGLYHDVLNRNASDAEIAGWVAALDNGTPRSTVSVAFLTSQEYRTDLVQADYLMFLLRPADADGLAAWVNALNAGATDQQVLAGIFGSPEGYQLWS
jgi:hypothetical protein